MSCPKCDKPLELKLICPKCGYIDMFEPKPTRAQLFVENFELKKRLAELEKK